MSHHLTEEYWELLGPNGLFLFEPFHNQSQQLTQHQMANNAFEDCALEAQGNVTDTATKATFSIAQVILTNMPAPTGSHLSRNAKPEIFEGVETKPNSLSGPSVSLS